MKQGDQPSLNMTGQGTSLYFCYDTFVWSEFPLIISFGKL